MLKIDVYSQNHPSSLDPDCQPVDLETARAWKKANRGMFIKHGTAFRLITDVVTVATFEGVQITEKSRWMPRPSGTVAIGYVNVLQLV